MPCPPTPSLWKALENFVEVLCACYPAALPKVRQSLCALRDRQLTRLLSTHSGVEAADQLESEWTLGVPWATFRRGWRMCRGTWPGSRGHVAWRDVA